MSLTAGTLEAPKPRLASLSERDLAHIPGEEGWPLVGHTFALLADAQGAHARLAAKYGPVYRHRVFGLRMVALNGPEANEFVLLDRQRVFSAAEGWAPFFGLIFPGGLLSFDFEAHRLQRRAQAVAFKAEPMRAYLENINAGIAAAVTAWSARGGEMRVFPEIKALTLNLAAASFFGRELGADLEAIKRAFHDMVAGVTGLVRSPLPGTAMGRAAKARRYMVDLLTREIPARRAGAGEDLFSQLCRTTLEDGRPLTDAEIVDHMSATMFAAHDTLTSSLTSFVWFLCRHPEWQARLREEALGLGLPLGAPLPYDRLDDLPLTEMAFKETLRLKPPASGLHRRLLRDVEFAGLRLPAGARVTVSPLYTHHMPELWPDPFAFDPYRFREDASRERHKYAFVPFGGGAHMCIGTNFAYLQAKAFAYQLLTRAQVSVAPGYAPKWRAVPLPRPNDGLLVRIGPRL